MGKERKIGGMDYFAYACSALVYILPQYLLSSFLSAYYTDVGLATCAWAGLLTRRIQGLERRGRGSLSVRLASLSRF